MSENPGAVEVDGPAEGLTDAEKLAALETYIKALKPYADALRAKVTEDFGIRHVEKIGAYLPDGTKMASVSYRAGAKTARVTDPAAALRWALVQRPEEVVQSVRDSFMKALLDYAVRMCEVGEHGVDPLTGQELPWIDVVKGAAGVTVTTTADGRARMGALAGGYAGMIEAARPNG